MRRLHKIMAGTRSLELLAAYYISQDFRMYRKMLRFLSLFTSYAISHLLKTLDFKSHTNRTLLCLCDSVTHLFFFFAKSIVTQFNNWVNPKINSAQKMMTSMFIMCRNRRSRKQRESREEFVGKIHPCWLDLFRLC